MLKLLMIIRRHSKRSNSWGLSLTIKIGRYLSYSELYSSRISKHNRFKKVRSMKVTVNKIKTKVLIKIVRKLFLISFRWCLIGFNLIYRPISRKTNKILFQAWCSCPHQSNHLILVTPWVYRTCLDSSTWVAETLQELVQEAQLIKLRKTV
jgi:hypothetical protein